MFFFDFVKWTGAIFVIIYMRLKKLYVNKKSLKVLKGKPYIVVCNHHTWLDPFILLCAFNLRRLRFVATEEILHKKIWGKMFQAFGCIEVDKKNVSIKMFKEVLKTLDHGHLIGIFPEGGIIHDSALEEFRSGAVLMALVSGVDILPMYIHKRKKFFYRQRVVIGEPLNFKEQINGQIATMDEIAMFTNILYEKEQQLKGINNEYENRKK
jgi:1-acyl-sn-glycerol-3-phosphate acyltransferase